MTFLPAGLVKTIVGFSLLGAPSLLAQQPVQKPSSLVAPALDSVAKAGSAVDLNKWKGGNAIREEVDTNLASMQKDLATTLPPLLTASDDAPALTSASLPVLLNLDALYSVLLRVTIMSRGSAPRDQNQQLERAAQLLDAARRDLGETILAGLKSQEKRIAELQATVQQQAATLAAAAPTPPPPPSSPPVKKHKAAAKKPAAKPAPAP
jgi:cell division septation protein DedD